MISLLLVHVSWVMVIVAAVVGFIIGSLWYSPLLFGNRWARLAGVTMDPHVKILPLMVGAFGVSLAHAYGIAWLLERMNALNRSDALVVVALVSILFVGANMVSGMLWERRSPELVLINWGSTLVCYVAMALLFVATAV